MKKIKLVIAALLIAFVATSCENVGLLGQGGVKGSKAKSEIMAQIQSGTFINYFLFLNKFGAGSFLSLFTQSILLQFTVDGAIVPGLAGVSDSKHYSRKSVDDCKDKIQQMDVLLGINGNSGLPVASIGNGIFLPSPNVIGGLQCDLHTTPALLQLGDGDSGKILQLGPIGL